MISPDRIENITIVGGGTAGWLTALILSSLLNNSRDGAPVKITLIESPDVPRIGVGEATVPSMPGILQKLGVDEAEFIRRCNATFKMSVCFDAWFQEKDGAFRTFHHPFNSPPSIAGFCAGYHYHSYEDENPGLNIAETVIPNVGLAKSGNGPRMFRDGNFGRTVGYAYHLDAALFAEFLQDICIKRGVRHVLDTVTTVCKDERGYIASLELSRTGNYPVEFVIDCSGFQSLIIEKAMGEPFISYSDQLLNDRAIPIQLPHPGNAISSYTKSSALTAGWVWRVPLYNRVGTGYVYSSRYKSDDAAYEEYIGHLRATGDLPAASPAPDARVIKMRIGHSRRAWVKNCLAIGLSGGFLEPLEATGIFLVDVAARWFVGHFPDRNCSDVLADRYNSLITNLYSEIRDFIQTHYHTSNREEPFWVAARQDVTLSETLKGNLALWKQRLPEALDTRNNTLFTHWNYIYILSQKDYFRGIKFPLSGSISKAHWRDYTKQMQKEVAAMRAALPKHRDLLEEIRNARVRFSAPLLPGLGAPRPRKNYS